MKSSAGFTLAEILVVMAITAVIGTVLVTIFTNTLRGSNKSQILANIKQNGQAVLENMDKTIRGADNVVCVSFKTLLIEKDGCYTRYRFVEQNSTRNGQIQQDHPQPDPNTPSPCIQNSPAPSPRNTPAFLNAVCPDADPLVSPKVLTDTNTQTGVSVSSSGFFTRIPQPEPGFKDSITIKFNLSPAIGAPAVLSSQIDPVSFETTIGLR
ncbi:type II secretion system protein [Candidatus Daviesbacteria bacterium]|nr:type II secretion system protein [Candidatus Daviesbacteria bacterium]